MNFDELQLHPLLIEAISYANYVKATPIQEMSIPIILQGRDLIGCAQTGTGKTAAFALPVMSKLLEKEVHGTQALIIVPTRELAIQIAQWMDGLSYFTNISAMAVYGGGDGISFEQEKTAFTKGANIIIATPGRLQSHINLGYVNFSGLKFLILDEADRMLDMGFFDDIMRVINIVPKERQTLLFSATMPAKIRQLASKILRDPAEVSIAISKPAEGVVQGAYLAYDAQKVPLIKQLLAGKEDELKSVIIFASRKETVKSLENELKKQRLKVRSIHSDLEQSEREEVMRMFKSRQIQALVATDIVSRGIDIDDIGLVINFDVPGDAEDYIHRIGRTARAESTGVALSFINDKDTDKFMRIEQFLGKTVQKIPLPEGMGEGPAYVSRPKGSGGGFHRKGSGSGGHKGGGGKSGFQRRSPNKTQGR
ncbi:MAG: DEAD/DEAH box helicase [Bacteroidia bacterium]